MGKTNLTLELDVLIAKAKLSKAEIEQFKSFEFTPEEEQTISAIDLHINKLIGALIHLAKQQNITKD